MPRHKIAIIDLDGTLADSSKRLQRVGFDPRAPMSSWPTDWGDCREDTPIGDLIELAGVLYEHYTVWIVTIRPPEPGLEEWLHDNDIAYDKLHALGNARYVGDSPAELKRDFISSLDPITRDLIAFTLEDSPSMVQMFREEGIRCLDVGPFFGSMTS